MEINNHMLGEKQYIKQFKNIEHTKKKEKHTKQKKTHMRNN